MSAITIGFLSYCCERLAAQGKRNWLLIWDNARLSYQQNGADVVSGAQPAGQADGQRRTHLAVPARPRRALGRVPLSRSGCMPRRSLLNLMECSRPSGWLNAFVLTLGAPMNHISPLSKWSYQLLDAAEQRLLQRLSVFAGGCTLKAVEAIGAVFGDIAGQVFERVASLIDKSMLQQTEEQGEEPRLLMLETIREYGQACLAASGEEEVIRHAHAGYYLRLSETAEQEIEGPQQALWLERLEQEHDNLRTALSWWLEQGETGQGMEMALRLGAALEQFWMTRGHYSEGRIFLERALAGREGVASAVQAKALGTAAWLAINQGDTDRGEVLCEESLSLWQELGDTPGIALSLQRLAVVAWVRNNPTAARALMEEALACWKEVGDKRHVAWVLTWLAYMASQQGEYTRALALCEVRCCVVCLVAVIVMSFSSNMPHPEERRSTGYGSVY